MRTLRRFPGRFHPGTHSSRKLNVMASMFASPHYLEIGLQYGFTFEQVRATRRIGVDPEPRFAINSLPKGTEVFVGTSDEFFDSSQQRFDLVFIDGLHTAEQTYSDLIQAVSRLKPGGMILVDDVRPIDEPSSLPSLAACTEEKARLGIAHHFWYGDVYKVLGAVEMFHPELDFFLVGDDPNHVQAIVRPRSFSKETRYFAKANTVMENWKYSDFFSPSGIMSRYMKIPEKELRRQLATKITS